MSRITMTKTVFNSLHTRIFRVGTALLLPFLASCSSGPTPSEMAVQAAKAYYDQLLQGDCDAFVAGTVGFDSIPESYRSQLVDNMKMFLAQQQEEHQGIASVTALRATVDTVKETSGRQHLSAQAFLLLCYGDSTREEVVVPMQANFDPPQVWRMK